MTSERAAAPGNPRWHIVFALLASALLIFNMQSGMVAVALGPMTEDLQAPIRWSGWVLTMFPLGMVISLPVSGRLAERFGALTVFAAGLFVGVDVAPVARPVRRDESQRREATPRARDRGRPVEEAPRRGRVGQVDAQGARGGKLLTPNLQGRRSASFHAASRPATDHRRRGTAAHVLARVFDPAAAVGMASCREVGPQGWLAGFVGPDR
jgi:hypothetical protein